MKRGLRLPILLIVAMLCIFVNFSNFSFAAGSDYISTGDYAGQSGNDYRYWSQGTSVYPAIRAYGCWIVAMSKMMYETGVDTRESFNPDRMGEWLAENGYIADIDNIAYLGNYMKAAPQYAKERVTKTGFSIEYVTTKDNPTSDDLWGYINSGYYTVIEVQSGGHYVYIDNNMSKQKNKLYIDDSFTDNWAPGPRVLSEAYGGAKQAQVYKRVDVQGPKVSSIGGVCLSKRTQKLSFSVSDNYSIKSVKLARYEYGQAESQAATIEEWTSDDDKLVTSKDISFTISENKEGIFYYKVIAVDYFGNKTTKYLEKPLIVFTVDVSDAGTYKVTSDKAPLRIAPRETLNGKSTNTGVSALKGTKLDIIGSNTNPDNGHVWYQTSDERWVYSSHLSKCTWFSNFVDDLLSIFGQHQTGGYSVSQVVYTNGQAIDPSSDDESKTTLNYRLIDTAPDELNPVDDDGPSVTPAGYYKVSFDGNGGLSGSSIKYVVAGNTYGSLPTASRSGYHFVGWYTQADGGEEITSNSICNGDITLYAHWGEKVSSSGSCGEHLTYSLRSDGTMIISGYGEMTSAPWTNDGYNSSILEVSLPEGLTSIYDSAFAGSHLYELALPSTLTSIGNNAFSGCSGLTSLTLADSVKTLGDNAFRGCSGLTKVQIPITTAYTTGTSSTYSTFTGCINVEEIEYTVGSGSVNAYTNNTYYNSLPYNAREKLTKVTLEDGITEVPAYLLNSCSNVTYLYLPDSIEKIGMAAFSGCSSWKPGDITFSDSLTSIGSSAFSNVTIDRVLIPASVTEFGSNVFTRNSSLKIYGERNTAAENYAGDNNHEFIAINEINISGASEEAAPGSEHHLTASMLTGIDKYADTFEWTVSGCTSEQTSITTDGVLSIAADEKAGKIIVTAKHDKYTSSVHIGIIGGTEDTDISKAVVDEVADAEYTGEEVEPEVKLALNGTELTSGTDYTVEYRNNTNAGEATITCTGIGKYSGTKEIQFNILKAENTWTVELTCGDVFTGNAPSPSAEAKFGEVSYVFSDAADGTFSGAVPETAGDYYVKAIVGETDNYSGLESDSVKFSIIEGSCDDSGHDLEKVEAVAATCIEDGNIEYWVCRKCGKLFGDKDAENEIDIADTVVAAGHKEEVVPGFAATCTEKGLTEGRICPVCGEVLVEQVEIPALGHSFGEWVTLKESTCQEKGSRQRVCEACGLTETEDLDLAAHDWESDYRVDVEPTCGSDGSESIHCKNCDAVTESRVIPATSEHSWDGGVITKEATESEEGIMTFTCTVCGEARTESIPVIAHTHVSGEPVKENVKEATCTAEGSYDEVVYCTKCGEELSRTKKTVARVAHTWGKSEYKWNSDYTEVTGTHTCSVCGEKETATAKRASVEVVKTPTAKQKGEIKYTSEAFTVEGFEVQTKTVEIELSAEEKAVAEAIDEANDQTNDAAGKADTAENSTDENVVSEAENVAAMAADLAAKAEAAAEQAFEKAEAAYVKAILEGDEAKTEAAKNNLDVALNNLVTAKVIKAAATSSLAKTKKAAARVASAKAAAASAAAKKAADPAAAEELRKEAETYAAQAAEKAAAAETAAAASSNAAEDLGKLAENENVDSAVKEEVKKEKAKADKSANTASESAQAAETSSEEAKASETKAEEAVEEIGRQGVLDKKIPKMTIKTKTSKKTSITIKWKWTTSGKKKLKKSKATKYEIWVCPNTKFAKEDTIVKTCSKSKTSYTVKGLKKYKKYYFKIRAIKYVGGVKHVGPWSSRKYIKTKKK